jgi:hypothetical protein
MTPLTAATHFLYWMAPTGPMPVGGQNDRDLFPRQRNLELLEGNKVARFGVVHCGNKADAIRCCINAAIQAGEVSAWEAGSFDG